MTSALLALLAIFWALSAPPAAAQDAGRLGGAIAGQVVDRATARPLPGAKIVVTGRDGRTLAEQQSDERGRYRIDALPAGLVRLDVTAEGYRGSTAAEQRVVAGKSLTLNVRLAALDGVIEEMVVTSRATETRRYGTVAGAPFDREQLRTNVGGGGDVFRSLNLAPGAIVTGANSDFTVRGRGPEDNLIFIDDIPFGTVTHFDQLSQLDAFTALEGGGIFSIFPTNSVAQAEFQPGGWEAAFGGANGAYLNLDLVEGNRASRFTSVQVDITGSQFLYDGPSYVDEDTGILFAFRFFDVETLAQLVGAGNTPSLTYFDFLFKSTTKLTDGLSLEVLAIFAPEEITLNVEDALDSLTDPDLAEFATNQLFDVDTDQGVAGVTLKALVGQTGQWNNIVYFRGLDSVIGRDEIDLNLSPTPLDPETLIINSPVSREAQRETEVGWRSDYSVQNRFGTFSAGVRAVRIGIEGEQFLASPFPIFAVPEPALAVTGDPFFVVTPDLFNVEIAENAFRGAAFIDQSFAFGAFTLRPGLRVDYDDLIDDFVASPRVQADWQIAANTRLTLTGGVFIQPPRLEEIAEAPGNVDLRPERSNQVSLGIEHYFSSDWRLLVEAYYQNLDDLIVAGPFGTGVLNNDGDGRNVGVDFLLAKRFSNRWSATLRYSFTQSRIDSGFGLGDLPAQFSRPHFASLTGKFELNQHWSFGGQFQIASGLPANSFDVVPFDFFGIDGTEPPVTKFAQFFTGFFDIRQPLFYTLNLRVDYRRRIGPTNLIVFLDLLNATNRTNIDQVLINENTGEPFEDGLGIIPFFGVTVEF